MRTITATIYKLDELPADGQRRAVEFLLECVADSTDEAQTSNEALIEFAEANSYEFYANGEVYNEV